MSNIEIKNFKKVKGHDGYGFTLDLYVANEKTAYVSDDGWGGPLHFKIICKEKMNEFDSYVSKQPSKIFDGIKIDPDRDIIISGMVNNLSAKKQT